MVEADNEDGNGNDGNEDGDKVILMTMMMVMMIVMTIIMTVMMMFIDDSCFDNDDGYTVLTTLILILRGGIYVIKGS